MGILVGTGDVEGWLEIKNGAREIEGENVGVLVVGTVVGAVEGSTLGWNDGDSDGITLSLCEGILVGELLGERLGGTVVGMTDGKHVTGDLLGINVGTYEGKDEALFNVGSIEGVIGRVGLKDGAGEVEGEGTVGTTIEGVKVGDCKTVGEINCVLGCIEGVVVDAGDEVGALVVVIALGDGLDGIAVG